MRNCIIMLVFLGRGVWGAHMVEKDEFSPILPKGSMTHLDIFLKITAHLLLLLPRIKACWVNTRNTSLHTQK